MFWLLLIFLLASLTANLLIHLFFLSQSYSHCGALRRNYSLFSLSSLNYRLSKFNVAFWKDLLDCIGIGSLKRRCTRTFKLHFSLKSSLGKNLSKMRFKLKLYVFDSTIFLNSLLIKLIPFKHISLFDINMRMWHLDSPALTIEPLLESIFLSFIL